MEHYDPTSTDIAESARRTVVFLSTCAYAAVTGKVLVVEHSLVGGKYCYELQGSGESFPIPPETLRRVTALISEWLTDPRYPPIECTALSRRAIRSILAPPQSSASATVTTTTTTTTSTNTTAESLAFHTGPLSQPPCGLSVEQCAQTKLFPLKTRRGCEEFGIIRFGGYWDYCFNQPHELDKSKLRVFEIFPYQNNGLIVRVGDPATGSFAPWVDQPLVFSAILEYEHWGHLLGIGNIGDLNRLVANGEIHTTRWVAEALHEKKLAGIAQAVSSSGQRVLCLAGPSSSGKTTTAKRIATQMRVCGVDCVIVSMDDYFLDHKDMPKPLDFESPNAVNRALLADRVRALISGLPIPHRKFDFKAGIGFDDPKRKHLHVGTNGVVIIEGIHMLNPLLWEPLIVDSRRPALLYVSCMTQLNIDDQHNCSTSDTRLLRRILRDHQYRGISAEATIRMWPNVRHGESTHITPFQHTADHIFNSSLVYELNVLAVYCRPLLCEVDEESPQFAVAERLLSYLELFYPLNPDYVSGTSILREFIGRSEFDY